LSRELRIPFCDPADPVWEITTAARKALEGDERAIVRKLAAKAKRMHRPVTIRTFEIE
jgi:hypothetical protein